MPNTRQGYPRWLSSRRAGFERLHAEQLDSLVIARAEAIIDQVLASEIELPAVRDARDFLAMINSNSMEASSVITLRHAESNDLSAVADLLYEVERFHGTVEFPSRPQWEQQIASLLFRDTPAALVLLAIEADVPQGFASYSFLWPAAGVSKRYF